MTERQEQEPRFNYLHFRDFDTKYGENEEMEVAGIDASDYTRDRLEFLQQFFLEDDLPTRFTTQVRPLADQIIENGQLLPVFSLQIIATKDEIDYQEAEAIVKSFLNPGPREIQ